MIKSELVQRIASQNPHLYQRDVENIVNAILGEIIAAMARGDRERDEDDRQGDQDKRSDDLLDHAAVFATRSRPDAVPAFRDRALCRRAIKPLAHFLAGLEERHRLLADRDMSTGARIASGAGRPVLH